MKRSFFIFMILLGFCSSTHGQSFVPFVIPELPSEDSPLFLYQPPIEMTAERIQVQQGHFIRNGQRVRFLGVNTSFGASLSDHQGSIRIARRLSASGINMVRLHHLDTSWYPAGLWNPDDGRTLSTEALDRLDYFIYQLAQHGIYCNLNLHVGRNHSHYLGLPDPRREFDKIVGIFTPDLIYAQKEYARQLLNHQNPYRGLTYAEDPAIALIEISNEDSFFMWGGEETLRNLPEYYSGILQDKWNEWLLDQYHSTEALRTAWSEGVEPPGENRVLNYDFQDLNAQSGYPLNWNFEQHNEARFEVSPTVYKGNACLEVNIQQITGTGWHLQINQGGFALEKGRYYQVRFRAAADASRDLDVNVGMAHTPWGLLGLSKTVQVSSEWKTYQFGFIATSDDANARVNFGMGQQSTTLYLTDVEFFSGGQTVLVEGESLENKTLNLFTEGEPLSRMIDRLVFLTETEKNYWEEMKQLIQTEIGCQALVTGTIIFNPLGLYAQQNMDFIDTHAYWQHPVFPGQAWDMNNWLIEQTAMTDNPLSAPLLDLAFARLKGKPFTVTEYNHSAPNDYQAECVPILASFAAAQDWDGIWLYSYSHRMNGIPVDYYNSFFDIMGNPAKWGFIPAATVLFRNPAITPFPIRMEPTLLEEAETLHDLSAKVLENPSLTSFIGNNFGITKGDLLKKGLGVNLYPGTKQNYLSAKIQEATTEIKWTNDSGNGFYSAIGRGGQVYCGRASAFKDQTRNLIDLEAPDFVVLTQSALDYLPLEKSRRILITTCGRCENTGMTFSADRRTVGNQWGNPPVRIETTKGILYLPIGDWECTALGPDGLPTQSVPVQHETNHPYIELGSQYQTMWYLLNRAASPSMIQITGPAGLFEVSEETNTRITTLGDNISYSLFIPKDRPGLPNSYPLVLLNHGFARSKEQHLNNARYLAQRGIAVMVPNMISLLGGESAQVRNIQNTVDHLEWLLNRDTSPGDLLHNRVDENHVGLAGHSAGGAVVFESAILAQENNLPMQALCLLDAVPWDRTESRAVELLPLSICSLRSDPGGCNSNGRILSLLDKLRFNVSDIRIVGASHCDPENPTDNLCSLFCGGSNSLQQEFYQRLMYLFFRDSFDIDDLEGNPVPFQKVLMTMERNNWVVDTEIMN